MNSNDFYSIDKEKIKALYNEIYVLFVEKLENIKTNSISEQNIMKNISEFFLELSSFYINSLFPYDILDVIMKMLQISNILKKKKFLRLDVLISQIITHIKEMIDKVDYFNPNTDQRYDTFAKKNDIMEKELDKIFKVQNSSKIEYLKKYFDIITEFIEKCLNIFFPYEINENELKEKYNFNTSEIYLYFDLILGFVKSSLHPSNKIYRKAIQILINCIIQNKVPVPLKALYIQKFFKIIANEYNYYLKSEWIIFKSEEEYMNTWNKLKYEIIGKESMMIPYPLERIRIKKFIENENLYENSHYDLNEEQFLCAFGELDELEEDFKLSKSSVIKLNSLDELTSKLILNRFNEKKGLDFKKAKMFFHLFKLNYFNYNNNFLKNLDFSSQLSGNSGNKIMRNCVIYEFLLGKYEYLLENNLFTENDKITLWKIMDKFTKRVDKIVDERIYAFFNYIFSNYSLKNLEFIFKYDFYKYPIDFVADMYFLYHQDLPNLRKETKLFDNSKTEELLKKIFSTDENIILDINYLVYVLKIYYTTNNLLMYNYYTFQNDYNDKIYEHYMKILEQSDTKHRRNALLSIYSFFFDFLNLRLPVLKASIQKISLLISEFSSTEKTQRSDKGKKILQQIENYLKSFTGEIHFPSLCNEISDLLNKENDFNDSNKNIYLRFINVVYKSQRHLNLFKYSSQEIFDSLFKVTSSIKNEEMKKNFSMIYLTYFTSLKEDENQKFIEKYEKYIFNDAEEDQNRYNYIYILMNQIFRFKINMPKYLQDFIIKLKNTKKSNNNKIKKIITDSLKTLMNYYSDSYVFVKENISEECKEVLEDLTKDKAYFI